MRFLCSFTALAALVSCGVRTHQTGAHARRPPAATTGLRHVDKDEGYRKLIQAIRQPEIGKLKTILDSGVNPDYFPEENQPPLLQALESNNVDAAMYLLQHGASARISNAYGQTPLLLALRTNSMPFGKDLATNA